MADQTLSLAANFPPATHDDWVAAAEAALRGAGFDRLRTRLTDGIVVEPLYTPGDAAEVDVWPGQGDHRRGGRAAGASGGWDVRQAHAVGGDAAAVNAAILADLQRGVTSIELDAAGIVDDATLDTVLADVLLDLAPIGFVHHDSGVATARRFLALAAARGVPGGELVADLGLDPVGVLARRGGLESSVAEALTDGAALAAEIATTHPGVRVVRSDGSPYADGGATPATELACVVAGGVAWLRALTDAGLDVASAAAQVQLVVTVGTDQFTDIAKLRASRVLWSRVLDVSGAPEAPMHVQATLGASVLTTRDPWVNMLRATLGCFAAGVGGADTVLVRPFDAGIGAPDELGLRIARNTQLILMEETNLHRVVDPAGGSWYVESLTDAIADAAWSQFREIEAAGGIVAALEAGTIQDRIDESWAGIAAAVARRKRPITGVSEFPELDARPLSRPPAPAVPGPVDDPVVRPIPVRRLSAGFEELRDAADAAGDAARVFVAALGPLAVHNARATWATNAFAAGGIRVLHDPAGQHDPAQVAEAFRASGCTIAVLCSSDAVYAEWGAAAATALRDAGATWISLAGDPGERRDADTAAGVDDFVHVGVDVLAFLRTAHERLGLRPAAGEAS